MIRPRRRGPREFKLTWLIERAVAKFFEEELPHLGESLYQVGTSDAEAVERRVRTLIYLMLLRDPGLDRYSRLRTPLMRVEWQADDILSSRWKAHNRLRAERNKRRQRE